MFFPKNIAADRITTGIVTEVSQYASCLDKWHDVTCRTCITIDRTFAIFCSVIQMACYRNNNDRQIDSHNPTCYNYQLSEAARTWRYMQAIFMPGEKMLKSQSKNCSGQHKEI